MFHCLPRALINLSGQFRSWVWNQSWASWMSSTGNTPALDGWTTSLRTLSNHSSYTQSSAFLMISCQDQDLYNKMFAKQSPASANLLFLVHTSLTIKIKTNPQNYLKMPACNSANCLMWGQWLYMWCKVIWQKVKFNLNFSATNCKKGFEF